MGEEIAISTRMNSFVQKIFDLHNLGQAAAAMVFNQDDYLLMASIDSRVARQNLASSG